MQFKTTRGLLTRFNSSTENFIRNKRLALQGTTKAQELQSSITQGHKRNCFNKEQTCEFESGLLQTHRCRKTLDSSKMLRFGSYLVFPAIGMTFSIKTERNSKIF